MRKYDKYVSFFWLFLALVIIYGAYKLELGILRNPGPGLFIFILGIFLLALALALLISSCIKQINDEGSELRLWAGLKWQKPIYILTGFLIYTLIIKITGYCLSTFLLLIFLFNVIERQRWELVIFETALVVFFSFLIFGVFLQIQFPKGLLEILAGYK